MNFLLPEVSQLTTVAPELLMEILKEISSTHIIWKEEYYEYQTSGWKTASLINPSGDANNMIVAEGSGKETSLLGKMPATREFLQSLNLNYFMVRIANLAPGSFLWEHRDYAELNASKKIRLHVPIKTNNKCYLIINKTKVFMDSGFIWKLDPTSTHGACNKSNTNRIHLLLDCYMDEKYLSQFNTEFLDPKYFLKLEQTYSNEQYEKAKKLIKLNFRETAEKIILKTYHSTSQEEGHAYDTLINLYRELGMSHEVLGWENKKQKFLALQQSRQ